MITFSVILFEDYQFEYSLGTFINRDNAVECARKHIDVLVKDAPWLQKIILDYTKENIPLNGKIGDGTYIKILPNEIKDEEEFKYILRKMKLEKIL